VTLLNAPGTIDADYRGEIQVLLINLGERPFPVHRGDRVAQMVIQKTMRCILKLEQALDMTGRDAGGFGHTGR
jgi:dUTP pyrophosphatase